MQRSIPYGFFLAAMVLFYLFSSPAYAVRCGTSVISEGDTKYRVLKRCGEPTHIEEWTEEHIQRSYRQPLYRHRDYFTYRTPFLVKENVTVEEWLYDTGSERLIRRFTFENGVLVRIRTGNYRY